MKRVLIIKVSSMGDIIHALPALTDASLAIPGIRFDWVAEPSFQTIPLWHPTVDRVIPLPFRRWRQNPWQALKQGEWRDFWQALRLNEYDAIIDAQGLMKTAWITWLAKGPRIGLDFQSARERLASVAYQKKVTVQFKQHAVVRARQLFAGALGYQLPKTTPNYGLNTALLPEIHKGDNTLIFLHGTTWATKHWPVDYWAKLVSIASAAGFHVLLPWGSASEKERATWLATHGASSPNAATPTVLPKLSIPELTRLMSQAKGIVAVDTGLCHIAAALAAPTVSIYGPTDPALTGAQGDWQRHLKTTRHCAPCLSRTCKMGSGFKTMPPCFESTPPELVWQQLTTLMEEYAHLHATDSSHHKALV